MLRHKPDVVAVITARGGSKRLPGKNVRLLAGKPLIAWTIESALRSRYLRRVIVSTDDKKIAHISLRYGAEVPFMRPKALARDNTSHIEVIRHALDWFRREEGKLPDFLVLLQPTSPFRNVLVIDRAIRRFSRSKAQALVSVRSMSEHPYLARSLNAKGYLVKLIDDRLKYRRAQNLPRFYIPNGAIYIIRPRTFLSQPTFFPANTMACVMSGESSVDVDRLIDFQWAEFLFGRRKR